MAQLTLVRIMHHQYPSNSNFREASKQEHELLRILLEVDFPGVEQLRQQLSGVKVRQIDPEGSLELQVEFREPATVNLTVPVEGSYSDAGSTDPFAPRVRMLLHVQKGFLHELEFYKDDGSEILKAPEPGNVLVEVNEAPKNV